MSSQENNHNHPFVAIKHHRNVCEMKDCRKIPTYGFPGERKTRCNRHQLPNMIRL